MRQRQEIQEVLREVIWGEMGKWGQGEKVRKSLLLTLSPLPHFPISPFPPVIKPGHVVRGQSL
ncbi:MAG: hypothetical protein NTY36_11490 [Deltaproteobacteria bacterium]|nr:hypothetical protein [Deltaproteobacteria bacterium]